MFFLFREKVDFVDPNLGKITDAKCGQVRIFFYFYNSQKAQTYNSEQCF
jgi:hypothetical protein